MTANQLGAERYAIDTKLSIAQAYYTALLNEERERFSTNNLTRTEQYYKEGKAKLSNGKMLQNDLDRLRLDYENAKISYEEDVKNLLLSKMNLANQLGTNMNVNIVLAESLDDVQNSLPTSIISSTDVSKRIEIRQEQLSMEQNKLQIKKQDRLLMPTFALYGNWSALQLSSDFQLFNSQWWFPYHFFGFSVNMKLFDGLSRNRIKNEYKYRILQGENTLAKLEADLRFEVASSKIQLQNAHTKLKTAKKNYQLAEEIIKTDKERFEQDKITLAELNNAEYSLSTAQNNLLSFYYNFLIAMLNYQKAVGEL
jgi:outer membrane protein